jgi:ABC-2 type transport system ATP-binding protein
VSDRTAIAIETRKLSKRYEETLAVDRLDLRIQRGEVFGLLGPNGAGKTTTILMLLGLTEPTDGVALVDGLVPQQEALAVKRRIGYLPDDVGFYDDMTGRQNLRYTARLNRLPAELAEERIAANLDEVGLTDVADRKVKGYSRGMRQRLGFGAGEGYVDPLDGRR